MSENENEREDALVTLQTDTPRPEVAAAIRELEERAARDLASVSRRRLTDSELAHLSSIAIERLRSEFASRELASVEGVQTLWNEIVRDLYAQGMRAPATAANESPGLDSGSASRMSKSPADSAQSGSVQKNKNPLVGFLRTWLMPTLVTKSFIMFFGLNYAMYPGEGYGWGLATTMSFTVAMFCWFVWTNRNETEI